METITKSVIKPNFSDIMPHYSIIHPFFAEILLNHFIIMPNLLIICPNSRTKEKTRAKAGFFHSV
ncbi:hypothetical protein HLI_16200 [Halobacillus litoralis]|uniref:Uncharacterized protein n=1 Tax=Halobacillus litoralis TaxID=45668 RepID=A0A410MG04_9BACI|nr:hypothetical protein HLI_16200 [Halobacillus litoralis]